MVLSGWVAGVTLPLAAIVAWRVRRRAGVPLAARMRPHELLAYAVLVVSAVHMLTSGPGMRVADPLGIWLATAAFALLLCQVAIGMQLRGAGGARPLLFGAHRASACLVLGLVLAHVVLDAQSLRPGSRIGPSSALHAGVHLASSSNVSESRAKRSSARARW
jgi:hypothetical protein